jgi:hypothetical protein
MFLTKKHLSRRTLLKGAGTALALPLLDAMVPAAVALRQTAAARKLRVGFFYLPHGAVMNGAIGDRWSPAGSGADFRLNAITASLEPHKKYVTSFSDIKNDAEPPSGSDSYVPVALIPPGTPPQRAMHITRTSTWLSSLKADLPGPRMSETVDQLIARGIGADTRLASLQVAAEAPIQMGAAKPAPYAGMSFRDATTPLPMEHNPRSLFLRLFGDVTRNDSTQEESSLLDLIKEQTIALQRDLGPADRAVLDEHLTQVREAERRIENSKQTAQSVERVLGTAGLPPIPSGVMDNFDDQIRVLFDLIAIAYRTDMTRVVAYLMANERTNQTYDHIGVRDSFHPISHHANVPDRLTKLAKIQTWHMERFAEFLGKLAAIQDGEGTLLDNSLFLYGSNMSNSDSHTNRPLPTLVIGGAAGKLSGGRHITLREATPISNLHLSLLRLAGIEQQTFGDSTGVIPL